ncbi:MAG: tRNA (guanosine(37)-N1)-methyltransferase TrmD [Leptospiraceae bacterium]|nr:tRNA (guanosine(37)-N1)-methyltransferase TrmD [Leptospiraceae bacterium]MDW7975719.1 tRNA (guanosine(37)-N1)-methyltransferase TrmD [Leptospiraceae bacterium]
MFLFQIITLFPERFEAYFHTGLPKRALKNQIINYRIANLLDFAIVKNKKKIIDGKPFGGGTGMILRIEPVDRALRSFENSYPVIAMTPGGILLTQDFILSLHDELKKNQIHGLTFLSGYYEGFDQRILDHLVDLEVSIGDFVLNSGDLAILCFIDAFMRYLPGFVGKPQSLEEESFSLEYKEEKKLLEYPQYTKPREYKGWKVPEILLSGNHSLIDKWRKEKSLERTNRRKLRWNLNLRGLKNEHRTNE